MAAHKQKQPSSSGCIHLLVVGVVGCVLLFVNLIIVGTFIRVNQSFFSEILTNVRVTQAAMFFLGVMMLLVEYWVFDYLCDRYTEPDTSGSTSGDSGTL